MALWLSVSKGCFTLIALSPCDPVSYLDQRGVALLECVVEGDLFEVDLAGLPEGLLALLLLA